MKIPSKELKWVIGFNLFNIVDTVLTLWGVYATGAVEMNPFMAPLVHNYPFLFVLVKLIIGFGCTFMLIKKKSFFTFMPITLLYIGVTIWNISQLYFKGNPEVLYRLMGYL